MPLNKSSSKAAFSENVAAERNAGRPEAQAVAIAYSVQRQAHKDTQKHLDSYHAMKNEGGGDGR